MAEAFEKSLSLLNVGYIDLSVAVTSPLTLRRAERFLTGT